MDLVSKYPSIFFIILSPTKNTGTFDFFALWLTYSFTPFYISEVWFSAFSLNVSVAAFWSFLSNVLKSFQQLLAHLSLLFLFCFVSGRFCLVLFSCRDFVAIFALITDSIVVSFDVLPCISMRFCKYEWCFNFLIFSSWFVSFLFSGILLRIFLRSSVCWCCKMFYWCHLI